MLDTSAWWSMPSAVLALPCGSMSMTRTRRPAWANAAATFTVVVVLPTPPFWFATVRIAGVVRLGEDLARQGDPAAGVHGYLARERRVVVGCRQLGSQRRAFQLVLGPRGTSPSVTGVPLRGFTWNAGHGRSGRRGQRRGSGLLRCVSGAPPGPAPFHVKRRLGRHPVTLPSAENPAVSPNAASTTASTSSAGAGWGISPASGAADPCAAGGAAVSRETSSSGRGRRPDRGAKSEPAPRSASRVPSTRRHRSRWTPMLAIPGLMEPVQTSTPVTSSSFATQGTPEAAPTVSRAGTGSEQHTP